MRTCHYSDYDFTIQCGELSTLCVSLYGGMFEGTPASECIFWVFRFKMRCLEIFTLRGNKLQSSGKYAGSPCWELKIWDHDHKKELNKSRQLFKHITEFSDLYLLCTLGAANSKCSELSFKSSGLWAEGVYLLPDFSNRPSMIIFDRVDKSSFRQGWLTSSSNTLHVSVFWLSDYRLHPAYSAVRGLYFSFHYSIGYFKKNVDFIWHNMISILMIQANLVIDKVIVQQLCYVVLCHSAVRIL